MTRAAFAGMALAALPVWHGAAFADQLAFQCSMFADKWPQPELGSYDYSTVGADFVFYATQTVPDFVDVIVLEHCPTRQSLRVYGGTEISSEVRALMDELVFGAEPYTFAQMADKVRPLGATADVVQARSDSCACQIEAGADPGEFLE
jgi:hypothetical protein